MSRSSVEPRAARSDGRARVALLPNIAMPAWWSRVQPWLARAGWVGAAILVGWSLVGWSARWWWLGEICVNFTFQLACGGVVAAALLWLGGRTRAALACAFLCAWHFWPVARLYLPPPPTTTATTRTTTAGASTVSKSEPPSRSSPSATPSPADDQPAPASSLAHDEVLRVAHANLLYYNADRTRLVPWLDAEQPDLVALLEYSAVWRADVGVALEARFPHHLVTPDFRDPWSPAVYALALYSKRPFTRASAIETNANAQEFLDVELDVGGERLRVLVLHPNRPGESARTATRNAVLANVASRAPFDARTLILADLNATAWSPAYAEFVERTGLREAREGFGRLATWRSQWYIEGLWLDLDHILVGVALDVQGLRRGPDLGSDHRPLVARLLVRATPVAPPVATSAATGAATR